MTVPVTLLHEHISRAYAQMRRADWPALSELERCHKLYLIVRGQAVNVATGRPLPREPLATPAPPPPRAAAPPTPARRRDDRAPATAPAPFDPRAAAAGEYLHSDEDPS